MRVKKIKHLDSTNATVLSYTRLSVCQVTKKSSDLRGGRGGGNPGLCFDVQKRNTVKKVERIFLNIIVFNFFFPPLLCL